MTPSKTDRFDELEELHYLVVSGNRVEFDNRVSALLAERKRLREESNRPVLSENEAHLLISLVNDRSKQAEQDGVDNGDLYIRLIEKLLAHREYARSILQEGSAGSATTEEEQER